MKINEKTDLSELPEGELNKVKSNITKGAKDLDQLWASALELVHTGYEIAKVQRPDVTMEAAWKQYEEMIGHACKELAKARGIDGDWRREVPMPVSGCTVREATEEEFEFDMETNMDGFPVNVIRKAKNIEEIINPFYSHNITGHDIEMRHRGANNVCLYFCKDGKRTGDKVTIRKRK